MHNTTSIDKYITYTFIFVSHQLNRQCRFPRHQRGRRSQPRLLPGAFWRLPTRPHVSYATLSADFETRPGTIIWRMQNEMSYNEQSSAENSSKFYPTLSVIVIKLNRDSDCLIIYLDLRFRHVESIGKFRSFGTRQIFRLFERFLQGEDLLAAKGWPRVFLLWILFQAAIEFFRIICLVPI